MRRISGDYTNRKGAIIPFDVLIPSAWDELNPCQIAAVNEVLIWSKAEKSTKAAFFLAILFAQNDHILYHLPVEELFSLAELTNFLVDTKPELVPPFSSLRLGEKVCLPADPGLSIICFGEWVFAYQAYHHYCQTKDEAFLNELIVILFRPAAATDPEADEYSGDPRQVFNENHIPYRVKWAKELAPIVRHAVLAWFSSALLRIMADRPQLFPVKAEDELFEAPPPDDHRTWFTVFRELIGPKWGTTADLKFTNALFVLDALEEQQLDLKPQ